MITQLSSVPMMGSHMTLKRLQNIMAYLAAMSHSSALGRRLQASVTYALSVKDLNTFTAAVSCFVVLCGFLDTTSFFISACLRLLPACKFAACVIMSATQFACRLVAWFCMLQACYIYSYIYSYIYRYIYIYIWYPVSPHHGQAHAV